MLVINFDQEKFEELSQGNKWPLFVRKHRKIIIVKAPVANFLKTTSVKVKQAQYEPIIASGEARHAQCSPILASGEPSRTVLQSVAASDEANKVFSNPITTYKAKLASCMGPHLLSMLLSLRQG